MTTLAVEADVRELLREVLIRINAVDAKLDRLLSNSAHAQSLPHKALCRADLARLGRLLPAIGGALGSDPFPTRDLFEHESAALQVVRRGLSVKAISKLFARAAGIPIDGLMVRPAGSEFRVVLWQVVAVPGSLKPPETLQPPRASGSIGAGDLDA